MSRDPDHAACLQCGAIGCQEKYGQMLALEFEDPAVFGAVHHITVICYNLQHPDTFTDEALAWMRSALRRVIEEALSPQELRELAKKNISAGKIKVRKHAAPAVSPQVTPWTMTAGDIRTDEPDRYVEDIKAWARSILRDLDKC